MIITEKIKSFKDLLEVGDGRDYEQGQLEHLSASIDSIQRIVIFTALKAGVTPDELVDIHNDYHNFSKYLEEKFGGMYPDLVHKEEIKLPLQTRIMMEDVVIKKTTEELHKIKHEYIMSQIELLGLVPYEVQAKLYKDLSALFIDKYRFCLEPNPTPENPYNYKVYWKPINE